MGHDQRVGTEAVETPQMVADRYSYLACLGWALVAGGGIAHAAAAQGQGRHRGAAIGLVLAGQAWLAGDLGTVAFGVGETMILAATLLWAAEVMLAKHLLASIPVRTLAVARMGVGTVLLLGWLAASGRGGDLFALSADQWGWALLTGLLLSAYVVTWYAALARAQAVDVTAVLGVKAKQGLGLLGMRERVSAVGGVCDIWSVPNHGTTVEVLVPIGHLEPEG